MFRITTPDGLVLLTEKPKYIRMHKNGVTSLLCEKSKAEGVACNGKFYLFKDGLQCHEFDAGTQLQTDRILIEELLMQLLS